MTKLSQIVNNLTKNLTSRQKEFLEERFGVRDGQKKTLQELGDRYNITRERVRQIESEGLKIAKENFKKGDAGKIAFVAKNHLEVVGGIQKEDNFIENLKHILKDESLNKYQARLLFEISGQPFFSPENDDFHNFWYTDKSVLKKAGSFIDKAGKTFSKSKEQLIFQNKAGEIMAGLISSASLDDFSASNYLAVSKKFGINPYNDFGLSEWEEINPKTARAKAYLVLKKHGKPLHFRDIASTINKTGFNHKTVYPQTIHNELIKDNRFVLVGRGIYALREQGYYPGTAKEVIQKILKENGPLLQQEIIETIAKQRFLKENTILLNLQNKKYFKRLPNGRYHIA